MTEATNIAISPICASNAMPLSQLWDTLLLATATHGLSKTT